MGRIWPDSKSEAPSELLVVSELDGRAHVDTSEGGGLDLPVLDRVAEETHTRVRSLFGVVSWWAKIICSNCRNIVVMKVNDLDILVLR